jgi:hypothetical protein
MVTFASKIAVFGVSELVRDKRMRLKDQLSKVRAAHDGKFTADKKCLGGDLWSHG